VTRIPIRERLAQLEAQKKTLQMRLSKQQRAIDTRRKVLVGAMVLHRIENDDSAPLPHRLIEWLRRELPGFLVRETHRDLFTDILSPERNVRCVFGASISNDTKANGSAVQIENDSWN